MATLTAFKFDDAENAGHAVNDLVRLHQQQLITVLDAALVTWPRGKTTPATREGLTSIRTEKLDGSFWGMLFGLIFFTPLMSSSVRSFRGALTDVGIHDKFIHDVRNKVRDGTSALFVLSIDAISDQVKDAFKREKPELISTTLPQADENRLRELFGQAEPPEILTIFTKRDEEA
jgi:uncharacterized membrane protein